MIRNPYLFYSSDFYYLCLKWDSVKMRVRLSLSVYEIKYNPRNPRPTAGLRNLKNILFDHTDYFLFI